MLNRCWSVLVGMTGSCAHLSHRFVSHPSKSPLNAYAQSAVSELFERGINPAETFSETLLHFRALYTSYNTEVGKRETSNQWVGLRSIPVALATGTHSS